jgi:hypothetical protein
MNIIAAVEAASKALFAKAETDIKSEIANPNWADLGFLALIAFVILLMYNPVKQLIQPADLGILAGIFKVWLICHTARWIAAQVINGWKATTQHTNATTQTIATAPPVAPTAITSK